MRKAEKEMVEQLRGLLAQMTDAEFTDGELWRIIEFIKEVTTK